MLPQDQALFRLTVFTVVVVVVVVVVVAVVASDVVSITERLHDANYLKSYGDRVHTESNF